MKNLPKRSDDIYKEIESFEDYEFTNCIAYEMAIRNDELKRTLKNISNFDEIYKNKECLKSIKDMGLWSTGILYYLNIYDTKEFSKKEPILENILGFGNEEDFYYIEDRDFIDLRKVILGDLKNNIELKMKRPKLNFKTQKKTNIEINFSLPKNELIDYISKIKDNYDKDNSIIISPLELLGEKLETVEEELLKNKKTNKYLNKFRFADMFYIYDMYKLGAKQNKIQMEISYYYSTELKKDTFIDNATINKYYEIIKNYIDNLRYKELITGVKNKSKD